MTDQQWVINRLNNYYTVAKAQRLAASAVALARSQGSSWREIKNLMLTASNR